MKNIDWIVGGLNSMVFRDDESPTAGTSTRVIGDDLPAEPTIESNEVELQLQPAAFRRFRLKRVLSKVSTVLTRVKNVINRVATVLTQAAQRLPQPLKTVTTAVIVGIKTVLTNSITIVTTAVTLIAGCGSGACGPPCTGPGPALNDPQATLRAKADSIMNMCYSTFSDFKRTQHPDPFDWRDDGCSGPKLENYLVYNELFLDPCRQHDFGYRNYGNGLRLGRDEPTREWLDQRILQEMMRVCSTKYNQVVQALQRAGCLDLAQAIHGLIRTFGTIGFYGDGPPPTTSTTTTTSTTSTTTTTLPTNGRMTTTRPVVAVAGSARWISVESPFSGDTNNNSYTTFEYSQSTSESWTQACGSGRPGETDWRRCTVTGLTAETDYFIRVASVDPDGVNGANPQVVGPVRTAPTEVAAAAVSASSVVSTDNHLLVTEGIAGDSNTNSTFIVDVATSASGPWTQKCGPENTYLVPKLCRIHGLVPGTQYWVHVTTSDPDGTSGLPDQVLGPVIYRGTTNLALGRTISADPGWGCCPSPAGLLDGRIQNASWTYGFAWQGGTACWGGGCPAGWKHTTIDLGSAQAVNRLDAWNHDAHQIPRAWKVEVSANGVDYAEVFSTTTGTCRPSDTGYFTEGPAWHNPSCAQVANFPTTTARWIRYSFDDRTLYGGIHGWLVEIEVFGTT